MTASFGVSSTESGASHPQELLEEADRAMYLSKKTGRNRVTTWSATVTAQTEDRKDEAGVTAEHVVACTRAFPSKRSTP